MSESRGPLLEVLRTPEARFANLPGYGFAPHYLEVAGPQGTRLRMHYLDEGPRAAPVVLLLHGEPTWSYLYRKLIPVLVAAGLRAVAPDHIGFGRSDKLVTRTDYTFERHRDWLRTLVRALDLVNIVVVCQDWGGPIGLGVLAGEPERFAAVVAANTILPTVEPELTAGVLEWRSDLLLDWILTSQRLAEFPAGGIVAGVCKSALTPAVIAAYDAPFPDESYKAGVRQFPVLIPLTPADPGAAINRATWAVLARFERPFVTAFSDSDPATAGWQTIFQRGVPGAQGQPHVTIADAGHFLQEDAGEALAEVIVALARRLG
ncbi:MAG: haloalkane dehalogenase [Deltaproteobacteria bacterium]|nr:haloalkane dehalogenase [Deltaproteobacteria bacterium]